MPQVFVIDDLFSGKLKLAFVLEYLIICSYLHMTHLPVTPDANQILLV